MCATTFAAPDATGVDDVAGMAGTVGVGPPTLPPLMVPGARAADPISPAEVAP